MHPSDLHMKTCWSPSPTVPQWSYISIHAEDSICDNHLDPTTAAAQLVLQVSHVNVPVPQLLCLAQPANAYTDSCIISVHCAILHTSYGHTANCWENSVQATDEPTKFKIQIHIQIHLLKNVRTCTAVQYHGRYRKSSCKQGKASFLTSWEWPLGKFRS